ncbi:hypothetical protein ACQ4PT_033539 [Festuca glaucescens]
MVQAGEAHEPTVARYHRTRGAPWCSVPQPAPLETPSSFFPTAGCRCRPVAAPLRRTPQYRAISFPLASIRWVGISKCSPGACSIQLVRAAEVGRAKMSDFQTSTHRERWIFQPQDLIDKWTGVNRCSAETLAQYGTTRLKVDPVDGSISNPEPAPDHVVGSSSVKPLSCEEEQMMRRFYEQKIQEVCKAFKFPHKIQATAIIYFKRFYLQWSVMEHHPKHIMLTCVYSSCKVEENHVSAEELGKGINQDHQIILNNEMIVLKSLDFDLIVFSPYRSIEGFIDDMDDFCRAGNGAHQRLKVKLKEEKLYVIKLKEEKHFLVKYYVFTSKFVAPYIPRPIANKATSYYLNSGASRKVWSSEQGKPAARRALPARRTWAGGPACQ